ncbi:MAG: UDP-N-acetylmuramate dehydrogenase [Gammaproteobacteria bacterium]|nr:UDP-N-acetylmuramate dehydrogenase [Gammaproteobacteria bacterium]
MSIERCAVMRGEMRQQESMSRHTSWKAGGVARQLYRPADRDDLVDFLRHLPVEEDIAWVGLGSNLLVRDAGFEGTIVHTRGCLSEITDDDEHRFTAEAGVSCAVAARHAARKGLVGLEFFAGIPGTVGGALAMNAGAFGGETWQYVEHVEMLSRNGTVTRRYPDEFGISYREVQLPEQKEWFLSACFRLKKGDIEKAQQKIKALLEKRSDSQPIGQASCGSTFRNPQGDYAARLIESCGLKGKCIGDACVSEKHANFVINRGNATATDIEMLVDDMARIVFEQTGVRLQREFHVIGKAVRELN